MKLPAFKNHLLILVFLLNAFSVSAQKYIWEEVKTFPDTGRLAEGTRVFSKDNGVYIYSPYNYGKSWTGIFSPVVSFSADGKNFQQKGVLADSIYYDGLLFSHKNFIYAYSYRAYQGADYKVFLNSEDGVSFQDLQLNKRKENWYSGDWIINTLGVARDTLFAFASVYDEVNNEYRDSVYIFRENSWKGVWGGPYNRPFSKPVATSGNLILRNGSDYFVFNSFSSGPDIIPDSVMKILNYAQWVAGNKLISCNQNFATPFYVSDVKTGISQPLPLPEANADHFSVMVPFTVFPDSSIIMQGEEILSDDKPFTDKKTGESYGGGWSLCRIYRSWDVGTTWHQIDEFVKYTHPEDRIPYFNNLFQWKNKWYCFEAPESVWESDDKGITWKRFRFRNLKNISDFKMHDGGILLNNTYFSKDNGDTWDKIKDAIPGYHTTEIRHKKGLDGWLFSSPDPAENNLEHWYHYNNGIKSTGLWGNTTALINSFMHKGLLFWILEGNILEGRDLYTVKIKVKAVDVDTVIGSSGSAKINFFADEDFIYCWYLGDFNDYHGLYRSADMGYHWELIPSPVPDFRPVENKTEYGEILLTDMQLKNDGAYDSKTFRLKAGDFEQVQCNGLQQDGVRYSPLENMTDTESGKIYVWQQFRTNEPDLWYSSDSGENFQQLPGEGIKGQIIVMQESNSGEVFLVTNAAVYRLNQVTETAYKSPSQNNSGLKCFPNPASGSFNVWSEISGQLDLIDVTGRVVLSIKCDQGLFSVNSESLVNGIYIVKVTGEKGEFYSERICIH
jgi:hypothetical protein